MGNPAEHYSDSKSSLGKKTTWLKESFPVEGGADCLIPSLKAQACKVGRTPISYGQGHKTLTGGQNEEVMMGLNGKGGEGQLMANGSGGRSRQ